MNSRLTQTLALFVMFSIVRCASHPKPQKIVINPLAERISALELDLKDQNREISRLNQLVRELRQQKTAQKNTEAKAVEVQPDPPTVKLSPQENDETHPVSPLMDEVETIADSSQDSMHTYYRGLELYKGKKFEDAIEAFRAFINENPQHVYADRAQFFVVDSYFLMKEYGMVIVAANLLESKYPYSQRMAEATYKRGLALLEMNQEAQAKAALSQLMKNFPKDPSAELARKKWAELSKNSSSRVQSN